MDKDQEVEEIINRIKLGGCKDGIFIPEGPVYTDERGGIHQVVGGIPFSSAIFITSKDGAVRAGHYHLEDYHVCTVTKGSIMYYERPVGSDEPPKVYLIEEGRSFFTRPMVEHAMLFTQDTDFWCFSRLSRAQDNYEKDTIRLSVDLTAIKPKTQ